MCGIAGMLRPGGGDAETLATLARRMTDALHYRGPDASGFWLDAQAGVAFGHRRLSILDLSEAGAQPMRTICGRLAITFNGEIYNHLDIRTELEAAGAAPNWRGHSDTETLLYAIRHWGLASALDRANGMFVFGLWDAAEQTLSLCRDRFGEKPLFYGWVGRDLVFASELKAFATHPDWSPALNRSALTSFIRYSYIPAPRTIWDNVHKLPPASYLTIARPSSPGSLPSPQPYWSLREVVAGAQDERFSDEHEAADQLELLLSRAVQRQCISDVPLGAFLSGGIDSSAIVALMQRHSSIPVRTFSIGFSDANFNEAIDARRVAEHIGTSHTELYVTARDAIDVVPRLADIYDEPFADSSQIPTHLVSKLARQHVTVSLSGDAGDELFGGYNRHIWGTAIQARFRTWPPAIRQAVGSVMGALPSGVLNGAGRALEPVLPARLRVRRIGDQARKLAAVMKAGSFDEMYGMLCSIEPEPATIVLNGSEGKSWSEHEMDAAGHDLDPLDRMTLADSLSYLSDDILQKVDRAAMSVSLETRVPFLDRAVVEFAARLPPSMKVRNGRGKWLLRQVLYRHVPAELVDRPKTGFSIPLDDWLRGPLKSWATDLLAPAKLKRQALFEPGRVSDLLDQQLRGHNHGYRLWNVLMAQSWADRWLPR